jgi:hypothetical protein
MLSPANARMWAQVLVLCGIAALATCAGATLAQAQDTVAIKLRADSLLREACRGGTLVGANGDCRGALSAPRASVVRRNTRAILAAMRAAAAPPRVALVDVTFDRMTTPLWPSGYIGSYSTFPRTVVCASVNVGGVAHVGTSSVEVQYVASDSATWTEMAGVASCGLAFIRHGIPPHAPLYPVRWVTRLLALVPGGPLVRLPFPEPVL